jgi:hypothetical protein
MLAIGLDAGIGLACFVVDDTQMLRREQARFVLAG